MSIVKYPPQTIWLGGDCTFVNDVAAGVAITPGMMIERYNSSGTPLYRPHATAAAAGASASFALNQSMLNKTVDDVYAIGDLVEVGIGHKGATFWALIGAISVVNGDKLESAGNGMLQKVTTGPGQFIALESKTGQAGGTRVRVEVM